MSKCGLITCMGIILFSSTGTEARICNIEEFGRIGGKEKDHTTVIQKAINSCAGSGGGMVYIPTGDYGCGGLQLRSNVSLYLEAGATLWVSPKPEHYQDGNRFLFAEDETNITIEGRGVIRGTGEQDLGRKRGDNTPKPAFRVGILRFVQCKNVMIKDITVQYSDSWTFDLEFCEKVYITGVSILNNYYRVNADGIDPVSCILIPTQNWP